MSKLSLCIPAYNAAWCLPRLLISAQRQVIPFDEILIYDDCSTDNTFEVGEAYGATVIRGSVRSWNPIGKNKLAAIAKSDWLFFIDADDELLPNFSDNARKWLEDQSKADIVLLPYRHVDNLSGKYLGDVFYNRELLQDDPVKYIISTKIVNFELIRKQPFIDMGGFDTDTDILFIEDRAFAFKGAVNGLVFDTEEGLMCNKYYTSTSMSSANIARCWEAGYHLWNKVYKQVGDKYATEIVYQLHENAVWAAKAETWDVVGNSLRLAKEIMPNQKPAGSFMFLLVYKFFPVTSFVLRAKVLKLLGRNKIK